MLSASRRQPHLLHVSAVDRRQTWCCSEVMINNVNDAVYYAVIADETTHVANTQQMCNSTLCWADAQLNAHEHLTV